MKNENHKVIYMILGVLFLLLAMSSANAEKEISTQRFMSHAMLIDDENASLIGTEVQDNMPLISKNDAIKTEDLEGNLHALESENLIVTSYDDEVLPPINMENFKTMDNVTPEVIMMNGSAAIFTQEDIEGWKCDVGEKIVYSFERYPSEVKEQQTLIVGYILNGVMHKGEKFLDLDGKYEYKIEKEGEYFIYVINADSDYLSLKKGNIFIQKR